MGSLSGRVREQRRVILVLTDDAVRAGRRDENLVDLFDDDEAVVIGIPSALRVDDPITRQLSAQNKLRPGELLVQSPYNPLLYESADSAVTEFAVAKFMLLTRVCQLLGATSVKVDSVNARTRGQDVSAAAGARVGGHAGSVGVDHSLSRNVRERLQLRHTFVGREPDIDGARRVLADNGLAGDTTLESLIEMRAADNRLTKREIRLSLTQESVRNLHVAARYSGLPAVRVSVDFRRRVAENVEVVLQATVTFRP